MVTFWTLCCCSGQTDLGSRSGCWRIWRLSDICMLSLQSPCRTQHSFPEYPQIPRRPPLPTHRPVSLSAKISSRNERRIFGSRYQWRLADEVRRNQELFICLVPPPTCRCKEEGAASVMLDNTPQVFARRKGSRRDAAVANDELAKLSSSAWCQEADFSALERVVSFWILTCKY